MFKKLLIPIMTVAVFSVSANASAKTTYCYKNGGHNNSNRYLVKYNKEKNGVRIFLEVKQFWRGNHYVSEEFRSATGGIFYKIPANGRSVCKARFNYKYAG